MEGITYGLRDSFELLRSMTTIRRVMVVGGGAKNRVWRKMLADNMKVPVTAPAVDEGGAYGAVMLAAMGGDATLATVRGWVRETETIEPDETAAARYDVFYEQFQALYRDLRFRFDVTATLQ
jgi:xylulokinase